MEVINPSPLLVLELLVLVLKLVVLVEGVLL